MVSDSGGFDDKSFNQTSYKGLTDAKITARHRDRQVESRAATDYAKNIQSMVDAKCNIIVTVGFLLGDDTLAAAKKNSDVKFAIVDNNDPKTYPAAKNLKPLVFNTAAVQLPSRLPRRGHVEDQEGWHLRRRQAPDRDDLHGRLQPGRGLLQQTEERGREGPRLGSRPSRTASSPGDFTDTKAASVRRRA